VPGVTGRTPDVPPDTQGIVEVTMRPIEHQVQDAPEAASEIKQPARYRKDFGNHAPYPILLATLRSHAAANSYPATKSLVSARSVVVARGVTTRRKTNAAKGPA
jgi:hypothetical protein